LVSFDADGQPIAAPRLSDAGARARGFASAPTMILAADHADPSAWHRARVLAQE
jgi:hypothetical protein